jgi:glucosylceramidase
VRIASTSFGTTGWNGQVMDVAFRNPDGSTVLVAHNENDNPQAFGIAEGGYWLTYTLPGDSLATFTWTRNLAGPDPSRQVSPAGWTATASPAGPAANEAASAVDADASTRYSTGTGQAAGQFLQVDFGAPIRARQVVFDTGASLGDYPRGYAAAVSADGVNWTTVVADGHGAGQFTTIGLDARPVRYVRLTLTAGASAAAGAWWSVADIRAYVG